MIRHPLARPVRACHPGCCAPPRSIAPACSPPPGNPRLKPRRARPPSPQPAEPARSRRPVSSPPIPCPPGLNPPCGEGPTGPPLPMEPDMTDDQNHPHPTPRRSEPARPPPAPKQCRPSTTHPLSHPPTPNPDNRPAPGLTSRPPPLAPSPNEDPPKPTCLEPGPRYLVAAQPKWTGQEPVTRLARLGSSQVYRPRYGPLAAALGPLGLGPPHSTLCWYAPGQSPPACGLPCTPSPARYARASSARPDIPGPPSWWPALAAQLTAGTTPLVGPTNYTRPPRSTPPWNRTDPALLPRPWPTALSRGLPVVPPCPQPAKESPPPTGTAFRDAPPRLGCAPARWTTTHARQSPRLQAPA